MNDDPAARLKTLGAAVRARRLDLRLTQSDVESRGGPSHMTVRRVEHGERVKWKSLHALAQALGWEPAVLIDVAIGHRDVSALSSSEPDRADVVATDTADVPSPADAFEDLARLVPKLPLSDLNRLQDMVRTAIAIREGGVS
jgi:transcriptional regulator with XRE-family HTH domain